ncbi:efflux RND transporter periplasmic adaptor subunit [Rubripirellula reticaptiva]|uniref:Macrolide transporter subunit MacA n=1 Tax=Rubripirellula reticaptiva TaxID=2528013 RepID=A0A5C6EJA0_9BACT|nr:efflux RND transporter periplasmic adaptor subunit [Rubripirellula reticaptiva]TWU49813.1 macrolide transporter subunit MacA [Rubripirellula reticaptiva]
MTMTKFYTIQTLVRHLMQSRGVPRFRRIINVTIINVTLTTLVVVVVVVVTASVGTTAVQAEMQSVLVRTPSQDLYEGLIEPKHTIMIAASEVGLLESLDVEVGDRVSAGEVVARLDDAMQQSAVRIATLQSLMTGERDATKAELDFSQSRAQKLRPLAANGMARPDELARAETELRVSAARYAAAEEQFQLRQLELQRYQLQLERRRVRSPMAGVISRVLRKPGEFISPGEPSVVQMLVVDQLIAVFNIPVEDTPEIRVGAPVRIFLRSTSTKVDAAVTSLAPEIEGESGTLQVRVELDNAEGRMLAGDRCTLRFLPDNASTVQQNPHSQSRSASNPYIRSNHGATTR